MDCQKVKLVNGVFEFISDTIEDWEAVLSFCDRYEHVQKVTDRNKYTECYRVFVGKDEYLYLVEMLTW